MTLRISSPADDEGGRRRDGTMPTGSTDLYLSRLVKLIPGEAVVVYPFLNSRAKSVVYEVEAGYNAQSAANHVQNVLPAANASPLDTTSQASSAALSIPVDPNHLLLIGIAWLILLLVVLLRWQATRDGDGRAQWGAVAIAAISFFLWVPVMDGSFGVFQAFENFVPVPGPVQKFIPELLLVLWTILIPAFYRPQSHEHRQSWRR